MTRPLSPKRQRFVEEYLVDLNATQAAIRAGYNAQRMDQMGYDLLRKPEVAEAIAKAQAERAEKAGVSAEWVVERLKVESERVDEGSSHGARVQALSLLGKHVGIFDADNRQKRPNIIIAEKDADV